MSRVPVLIGAAVFERGGNEGVVSVLDLTERKHAEEERERLRQAQDGLTHMGRVSMMGELAASVAHEIKQPIFAAVIRARTGLRWLQRQPPNIEKARELLSRIVEDATRAATIVDRNRSLYKRETSQRETVDLSEVIRDTIALLQEKARKNSILIRTQLDAVLPTISADRVQVQQVSMTLILNGIEAMKETRGELTITSETGEHSQVLISVRDSGVGLPAGNPEQIFEAFLTTKPEGTGMGLSISRRIIESHGGRLWASDDPGGGANLSSHSAWYHRGKRLDCLRRFYSPRSGGSVNLAQMKRLRRLGRSFVIPTQCRARQARSSLGGRETCQSTLGLKS
jgi:signal transduction histidine kinase